MTDEPSRLRAAIDAALADLEAQHQAVLADYRAEIVRLATECTRLRRQLNTDHEETS